MNCKEKKRKEKKIFKKETEKNFQAIKNFDINFTIKIIIPFTDFAFLFMRKEAVI